MRGGEEPRRSDEQLLRAAGTGGDADAFGLFYRRHVEALLAYLLRRTNRPEIAADVCAETFARVLERVDRFDPTRGSARGWLFTIAHHELVDAVRRGRVEDQARRRLGMEPRPLTDDDLASISGLLDRADDVAPLGAGLPDAQREALHERIVLERDYTEIAASLSVSEAVVRQRVSRGLSSLRAQLRGGSE